jgi:predicted dehydrogenase
MTTAINSNNNVKKVRTVLVGCGLMAREHLKNMLLQRDTTEIAFVCEPSVEAYDETCKVFAAYGINPPPNEPNLDKLLSTYGQSLEAAFIITPHALHYSQTKKCLEAGLDVLLEKPMVMNAIEAQELVNTRNSTGKLLVVAFQGSLSPQIRKAVQILKDGSMGKMLNIIGWTWQNWKSEKQGTWRMDPKLAGGGFFFDTGAHLLNTVADLGLEDYEEVCGWLDNRDTQVDIVGAAMGKLKSGTMVSLTACGDAKEDCLSDIRVYCTNGIIRTGMWGERLEMQKGVDNFYPIQVPSSLGVWQQFLQVRSGLIANPSPPEIGLRMAKLWDAIKESSAHGGKPVRIQ